MSAEIQVGAQTAAKVAAENHRLFAHIAGDEITGIGNLTFVAEIKPAARE